MARACWNVSELCTLHEKLAFWFSSWLYIDHHLVFHQLVVLLVLFKLIGSLQRNERKSWWQSNDFLGIYNMMLMTRVHAFVSWLIFIIFSCELYHSKKLVFLWLFFHHGQCETMAIVLICNFQINVFCHDFGKTMSGLDCGKDFGHNLCRLGLYLCWGPLVKVLELLWAMTTISDFGSWFLDQTWIKVTSIYKFIIILTINFWSPYV